MNFFPAADLKTHGKGALSSIPPEAETVGVRPDQITFVAPTGPAITLEATLELIEPVGGESHLHMRLVGSGQLVVVEIAGHTDIHEGEQRTLYLATVGMHCFNGATGLRVD